jgi:hypothetical protein
MWSRDQDCDGGIRWPDLDFLLVINAIILSNSRRLASINDFYFRDLEVTFKGHVIAKRERATLISYSSIMDVMGLGRAIYEIFGHFLAT